jgi:hypothetical protein
MVSASSGDGTVNPGLDHAVHASLVREGRVGVVLQNMVLEGELYQGEEEELTPLGVLAGVQVWIGSRVWMFWTSMA